MIQLLIISANAALSRSVEVTLSAPEQFQCHQKPDAASASALLQKPIFDACLLDADLTGVRTIREIALIRSTNPKILLLVLPTKKEREWEEEAILEGADFILPQPLRGNVLRKILLGRIAQKNAPSEVSPRTEPRSTQSSEADLAHHPSRPLPALEILRDFSRIFSYSFNLKSFTYQFALKLREIISVNRIAIFLEQARLSPFGVKIEAQDAHLKCLCSVGIEPELFNYLTLSPNSGIGQAVLRSGRILRANPAPQNTLFPADPEIQREFELLGGQIAIPILDRERAIGVAVLGDRLTGQSFSNEELQLLFHLMEELGLAIKSTLLHDQFVCHHKLISSVFSQMSSGCLVVDHDLNVLHVNPAFLSFLNLPSPPIQFSVLPTKLAGLLYEAAHCGATQEPFLYQESPTADRTFRISTIPFEGENVAAGAMMFVEDVTLLETARKAELETSKLRLIALIAERFSHEIRNSLVPINTCRQLIPERKNDDAFHETLEQTLKQETLRISRLSDHLLYLSKTDFPRTSIEILNELLNDAFAKTKPLVPENAELTVHPNIASVRVSCDPQSLKHAFFEILLNGFQANSDKPTVTIAPPTPPQHSLLATVAFEFRDQGTGIPPDIRSKALEPFFTTKNVGVGLGLSVARQIIEAHGGRLEINPQGRLLVTLPVST